jgi:integrase
METSLSFGARLSQFKAARCLNSKPKTVAFYSEWHAAILRAFPAVEVSIEHVTAEWMLEFARSVSHYCPSRWNAVVAFSRQHTGQGHLLKRRQDSEREFTPPAPGLLNAFFAECDKAQGSHAGLVARFLCHTGLRISEARALKWKHVLEDRIELPPSAAAKNGRLRCIPHMAGTLSVLSELRKLTGRTEQVLPTKAPRKAIASASMKVFGVRWSYHCFRHLFATRCIECDVPIPTIARWMGHKDGGALLSKRYFHLVDRHSREMALRVRIAA